MSSVEFFQKLPAKQCSTCGEKIEEMHECYSNECEKCSSAKL
ncbi:protein YhfH [Salisediminibacterium halotolerans]